MSKSNIKIVYSLWLHIALQEKGFAHITEMKNPRNQKFNCWVYEETPQFIMAFNELTGGGRNG